MNMNKEYRAELRGLKKEQQKINRAMQQEVRAINRADLAAKQQWERQHAANVRAAARSLKLCERASARITNRIAVLEGRLS